MKTPLFYLRASYAFAVAFAACVAACTSSTATGIPDAGHDAAPANQCTAYGQGYKCVSGPNCGAGFVSKQDYFCGRTTDYCCGPVGEGGLDASDDVNVFVDGAAFETGPVDAAHDTGHPEPDATVDSGHDAGGHETGSKDAGADVEGRDASSDSGHRDAAGKRDAAEDAPADATAADKRDAKAG